MNSFKHSQYLYPCSMVVLIFLYFFLKKKKKKKNLIEKRPCQVYVAMGIKQLHIMYVCTFDSYMYHNFKRLIAQEAVYSKCITCTSFVASGLHVNVPVELSDEYLHDFIMYDFPLLCLRVQL